MTWPGVVLCVAFALMLLLVIGLWLSDVRDDQQKWPKA